MREIHVSQGLQSVNLQRIEHRTVGMEWLVVGKSAQSALLTAVGGGDRTSQESVERRSCTVPRTPAETRRSAMGDRWQNSPGYIRAKTWIDSSTKGSLDEFFPVARAKAPG